MIDVHLLAVEECIGMQHTVAYRVSGHHDTHIVECFVSRSLIFDHNLVTLLIGIAIPIGTPTLCWLGVAKSYGGEVDSYVRVLSFIQLSAPNIRYLVCYIISLLLYT